MDHYTIRVITSNRYHVVYIDVIGKAYFVKEFGHREPAEDFRTLMNLIRGDRLGRNTPPGGTNGRNG